MEHGETSMEHLGAFVERLKVHHLSIWERQHNIIKHCHLVIHKY
jgi:hypothetical protein